VNHSRLQQHLRQIRQARPLVVVVAVEVGAVLQQDALHPVGIADEFGAHREERGQQSADVGPAMLVPDSATKRSSWRLPSSRLGVRFGSLRRRQGRVHRAQGDRLLQEGRIADREIE
jgi:hypothetical protein